MSSLSKKKSMGFFLPVIKWKVLTMLQLDDDFTTGCNWSINE